MLIRTKPRKKASNLAWRLAEILITALGLFSFYNAAHGVFSGEIPAFSRRGSIIIHAASDPGLFWFTVLLWAAGGTFLLSVAFNSWRGS